MSLSTCRWIWHISCSNEILWQVLAPCGVSDFVCGRASEWISNGTDLCKAAGFAVRPSSDFEETFCYGGKASLDSISETWRSSQSGFRKRDAKSGRLKDFLQWARKMPSNGKVSWAIGGMVLTAGLLFVRSDTCLNMLPFTSSI